MKPEFKPNLREVSLPTSSPVFSEGNLDGLVTSATEHDYFMRVKLDGQLRTTSTYITKTKDVYAGLNEYYNRNWHDISLLSSVIYWQKKNIDYQALYTAFLLDTLSEEDFEKEAEKFAVRQKEVQPELIAAFVERLDSLIGLKLDTSDYADYFQCSQNNVITGLSKLNNPHFSALLPSPAKSE